MHDESVMLGAFFDELEQIQLFKEAGVLKKIKDVASAKQFLKGVERRRFLGIDAGHGLLGGVTSHVGTPDAAQRPRSHRLGEAAEKYLHDERRAADKDILAGGAKTLGLAGGVAAAGTAGTVAGVHAVRAKKPEATSKG